MSKAITTMLITTVPLFIGAQLAMKRSRKATTKNEERKYIEKDPKATTEETFSSLPGQLREAHHTLQTYVHPTVPKNRLIPKAVIENAKGIIFLTVYKVGVLIGNEVGSGCLLIRNQDTANTENIWSSPVSVELRSLFNIGGLKGGSFHKKHYLFILNTDDAINELLNNKKLEFGENKTLNILEGPRDRDYDISVIPKCDIFSYPDSTLNKKREICIKTKTKKKQTNDIMNDVISGKIKMPQSQYYDQIISLLNTYSDDASFGHSNNIEYEEKENNENNLNVLQSIFGDDVHPDLIEAILVKQCDGNIKNAHNILLSITENKLDPIEENEDNKIEEIEEDEENEGNVNGLQQTKSNQCII